MKIRAYCVGDKENLVGLLRLNTPRYFAPSEEADFITYLDAFSQHYFVVSENDRIIAAGGINYFEQQGLARISWDIVDPAYQGKGIGRKLTDFRIKKIAARSTISQIIVRTSQLVYPFYEKMGFELIKTEKDFWAKGFDLYEMKMIVSTADSGK